jgi:Mg-chelatase subunit ChlD
VNADFAADILDLTAPVVFFPVRHHSPACARLVREAIERLKPSAVLIEGPSDFNDRLAELKLPHRLPIAIYSYARLGSERRVGAYYPFCVYSPEWQALQAAFVADIDVRFIDLPFAEIAPEDRHEHRYADGPIRTGGYIQTLCKKLGVEGFDDLWDTLFEIDAEMRLEDFLERFHRLCHHQRVTDGVVPVADVLREAFMAEQIRQAQQTHQKIFVVTGGFHSYALHCRLRGEILDIDEPDRPRERADASRPQERGIALIPYAYERLDALAGYDAGMPNPGFYHQVWEDRHRRRGASHRRLLAEVAKHLRSRKQTASAADLIAAETTAQALAALRGHAAVWRADLVDGIQGALVKDEMSLGVVHPMLQAVHAVFRGGERGTLAEGTSLPPLVGDIQDDLRRHGLTPEMRERRVELALAKPDERERSRFLHRLRLLGVAGFVRTGGADFVQRDDLVETRETWTIRWTPEYDATLIEASRYGVNQLDATGAVLAERVGQGRPDAEKIALTLLDAGLAGLDTYAESLLASAAAKIRGEGQFLSAARALDHLLYLYRYDAVLGTSGRQDLGGVLQETYGRSLWLLETLGQVSGKDREIIQGVRLLVETFDRCGRDLALDGQELVEALGRVQSDPGQLAIARGAATGGLWVLEAADPAQVRRDLLLFSDAARLGDFLTGLFALAREQVQRHPDLVRSIDGLLIGYEDDEFLTALPALRLAFTYFTPREKHYLARTLLEMLGLKMDAGYTSLAVPATVAAAVLAFESRLFTQLKRYGIRDDVSNAETDELESSEPRPSGSGGPESPLPDGRGSDDVDSSVVDHPKRRPRWRLVLGKDCESDFGACLDADAIAQDKALGFLYDREYGSSRNVRKNPGQDRKGSLDDSSPYVPEWINRIHALFPKRTIERLEKDALERYHLEEMVTNPDVLSRAQPNMTLLKAVLHTKHLMNQQVLAMARQLVRRVVDQLMEKLARPIQSIFLGAVDRRRRSSMRVAKNFDAETTIRRNLAHFDPASRRLFIETPHFYSRVRRHVDRWQIIIVVDESGSMADSVIHSAVTAAIFFGLKAVRTHLVLFDTNVVDVTDQCNDPVETIMKVQLGGGTDIGNALAYASSLIDNPRRTILILVTDFEEGGPPDRLLAVTKQLVESGVTFLGLAALDERAEPNYDRYMAQRLVNIGIHVAAMTPGELAEWVAQKVR